MVNKNIVGILLITIVAAVILSGCISGGESTDGKYDAPKIGNIDCKHSVICYESNHLVDWSCVKVDPVSLSAEECG